MTKKKGKRRKAGINRNKKEAIKKKARGLINRQSRMMADRMRKMAKLTESIDMGEEPPETLELDKEISVPICDGAGECCKNKIVRVNPGDIWRIMHNSKMRIEFGIELTVDLFKKNPEDRGFLYYTLDPRAGIPICTIRRDLQEDSMENCAFLVIKDGQFSCILGEDRPMACMANPVTRIGKKNELCRLDGWNYTLMNEPCEHCSKA